MKWPAPAYPATIGRVFRSILCANSRIRRRYFAARAQAVSPGSDGRKVRHRSALEP